jgi:rod shape-determining protein MreB
MDLGTAWSRAQACGDPVISTRRSLAPVGAEMAPALQAGVVRDATAATALVQSLMARLPRWGWRGPRVLACVPSDARPVERHALMEAIAAAGAAEVALLCEPVAAAIGAGADIASGFAHMVVDVGEGVTDASVVDQRGIVASAAVRVGCADLRAAVRDALRRTQPMGADDHEAERVLRTRGLGSGDASPAVREAIAPVTAAIGGCVAGLLRSLGDREACQVIDSGIVLTGGGALLPGMGELVEGATGVATRVADDPLNAVIRGASAVLREAARTGLWAVHGDRPLGMTSR